MACLETSRWALDAGPDTIAWHLRHHHQLADATDAEILTWLDDHSRYARHVSAWPRVTGPITRDTYPLAPGPQPKRP